MGLGYQNIKERKIIMEDIVELYIQARREKEEIEARISALETLILAERPDDERIKIYAGRKSYEIKDETYQNLEAVGIKTTVVETRRLKLKEFPEEIQKSILSNPDNYIETTSKESIRIRKEK